MRVELDVGQPFHLPPGAGEIIGDSEDRRVEILSDRDELHATWSRFGPGRNGADPHVHRRHTDLFYVLAGELTIGLGADRSETVVPAGSLVIAPPLVVHAFRNGNETEEVRYLNFHAPGGGFADYLRGRGAFDSEDPPADGGRPVEEASIGTGELVADRPGLRVSLLADIEEIGLCEVVSDPGAPSPPVHVHRRHSESFYVLEGEITFVLGERELVAGPGAWAHVPAGVPHTFALRGSERVRYLDVHTPGCGFGDFVGALNNARDEEELAAARAQFDQEPA